MIEQHSTKLRQRYATFLMRLIEPGIPMLLITNAYDQNEMEGPPFSVDEHEVMSLYSAHFNIQQLCHQTAETIPEHLRAKGLTMASEEVYYLSSKF